jgi:rRNA biogenesis protein RRP5
VDPSRQRLILTMKSSLVHTKLPIVSTYNDLQANLLTIGVIISIQEYGLLVKLFGDLCGLVPKNEIGQLQTLPTTNIKSQLQQMFNIGQTVSCKVINFDEEQKKITLSLKVNT